MTCLQKRLKYLSDHLSAHSIPWFSPRYNGHTNSDTTLAATLGYILTMLWNQNNASPEGGPMSSIIEYIVGQQFCKLVGYGYDADALMTGWGHITCDGTKRHADGACAARNLKFYPLSFYLAITEGNLQTIASEFTVRLCDGTTKLLEDCYNEADTLGCPPWELLNLEVDVILELASRVTKEFGISPEYAENAVHPYLVQQIGENELEAKVKMSKSPVVLLRATNLPSWQISCYVTGIDMNDHLRKIKVDDDARLDTSDLKAKLDQCQRDCQSVYAVITIVGTAEHGAVDPLGDIIDTRKMYQANGLYFYVHADAGYFATLLRQPSGSVSKAAPGLQVPSENSPASDMHIAAMSSADSVTIDPHLAGFVPYPAGGLCFRNQQARFMLTTSAPYVNADSPHENMGVYGLEGSKPGAAPVAVYLSHSVIGLHSQGYGALLGEAAFTAVKMYCNWATMSLNDPDLIVTPFTRLLAERNGGDVQYILDNIVHKTNSEILDNPDASKLIKELGSDLVINLFACHFNVAPSTPNTDVQQANLLDYAMYEALSLLKHTDDAMSKKIIIGSTVLKSAKFGSALVNYKKRLGLGGDVSVYFWKNSIIQKVAALGELEHPPSNGLGV
ncbi:hypothetical protein SERLADRAFT_448895 [Serpula lacrymans var. lacrymans S7.9]|uniref:PLP-dependent transferase n=1 Tax=Serpula lacrymans var. lacrymans (strain S7.9) TaxID=578457 RepID=F8NVA3_SERL9|nr:uncharacterized protein SERLADRAFT_448895 [Serpula lacrymans var. lacrymans S7.9]EGO26004.1 hypothetical protein SERLADRAFT_448895 [Serpula lacrymans var. lacrymans S7.9]